MLRSIGKLGRAPLVILGLGLLASLSVRADQPISGNGISVLDGGSIKLGASDPYLILDLPTGTPATKLEIPLVFLEVNENQQPSIQLFFKKLNAGFDARSRIHYQFNDAIDTRSSGISLPIPLQIDLSTATTIRLDIEACAGCVVRLDGKPSLSNKASENYMPMHVQLVRNGLRTLGQESQDITSWNYNHTDSDGNITGIDPFTISPPLDIDSASLGGLLLELNSNIEEEFSQYQLFYATEHHGFVERSGVFFQLAKVSNESQHVFIPLHHIGSGQPRHTILERLRLDVFATNGKWQILSAELVSKESANEYRQYTPKRMFVKNPQRARGFQLIQKIAKNLVSDLAFLLTFIALLITTSLGFIKSYQR